MLVHIIVGELISLPNPRKTVVHNPNNWGVDFSTQPMKISCSQTLTIGITTIVPQIWLACLKKMMNIYQYLPPICFSFLPKDLISIKRSIWLTSVDKDWANVTRSNVEPNERDDIYNVQLTCPVEAFPSSTMIVSFSSPTFCMSCWGISLLNYDFVKFSCFLLLLLRRVLFRCG